MKSEYAETYKYLEDCYDRLVPKCLNNGVGRDISDATDDTWYKYGRTQALTAFINTPKLIVRVLSKEPMYAFDNKDMLIASGGTAGYCAISKLSGYEINDSLKQHMDKSSKNILEKEKNRRINLIENLITKVYHENF